MKDSLNVAIAGATGYVGLELVKILSNHPKVKITNLCAQNHWDQKSINLIKELKRKIYLKL